MKLSVAAIGRLILIYGVPFVTLGVTDRIPSMRVYIGALMLVCIAWMFTLHFLTKSWVRQESDN